MISNQSAQVAWKMAMQDYYRKALFSPFQSSLLQHGTSKDDSCPSSPPSSLNPSTRGSTRHSSQYIATQGVLPNTVNDMWFMIWQERASIVILLTKESERGRVRAAFFHFCSRYLSRNEFETSILRFDFRINVKSTGQRSSRGLW